MAVISSIDPFQHAEAITRHHAKSFYFSSFTLPQEKRRRAYAVYALCRTVDDRIDEAEPGADLTAEIKSLRELLDRIYTAQFTPSDLTTHPWLPATAETLRECEIPPHYFEDLILGVEMDRGPVRLQNWEELDRYCYLVAGVVGLMMTRIFGLVNRQYEAEALDLGRAMQLTNILRDVAEDARKGRVYLPADELSRHGISDADLTQWPALGDWKELITGQIQRARFYYQRSEKGILHLPDDGSRRTVWIMRDVYAGILDAIEQRGGDVFSSRCYVPLYRKCGLVFRRLVLESQKSKINHRPDPS
ncbi:MAG: phytoene/squalene synthase family protein [Candidatus Methylacidiphilales bacterium]